MRGITSVGIIGAGALGLMYASAFRRVPGTDVFFIADGHRLEQLTGRAFRVNGVEVTYPARSPADVSPPDLMVVAVKNHHLPEIGPVVSRVCGEDTVVISVLNGIDSEPFLERVAPTSRVIYTVAVGMDAMKDGNVLSFTREGKLIIGTRDNESRAPEIERLSVFLRRAGLTVETPRDIHRAIWWKWMVNIGVNQVSAVLGAPYRTFQAEGPARELMTGAMRETIAVAEAAGIDLHDDALVQWYEILSTLGPENKTSMLQDVEAGRTTEVGSFGGRLCELAREHDIPTPINETLVRLIAAREGMAPGQ